ncbi:MAG TPA: hypothetical protein PLU37_13925 [Chitinophagaceae bacterium]|nr:hypothetical protein [Chitinophagaceae bacterium]MCB9054223.1 hypothetical protein [Chitinophagales bacterium]HPG12625.1 hypothetical protein [Chitinophagaceae bacterium]
MRNYFSEKNLVIVLFVTVLTVFSLAQEDSKKMDKLINSQVDLIKETTIKGNSGITELPVDASTQPVQ